MSIFHDRLDTQRARFNELTSEPLIYTHGAAEPIPITGSPIFKRSFLSNLMMSATKHERCHFAWDVTQDGAEIPLPDVGDRITRANGDVYQVQLEDDNSPHFKFITAYRNRIMVCAVLYATADEE